MIETTQEHNALKFSFPEVHPAARLTVRFKRTLRVPDNAEQHPLPAGLGDFPLRHVDDFGSRVPASWKEHGGVMLPMYQAEAMWIAFESESVDGYSPYPFAVKIATGKVNAVTGGAWSDELHREPQDYLVVPEQPWLDGYCVGEGTVRQFVAMPLGAGRTAEEQLTGEGTIGGLQIAVYPMTRMAFDRIYPLKERGEWSRHYVTQPCEMTEAGLGVAPGGKIEQELYQDRFAPEDWTRQGGSRCFLHLADSMLWRQITGEAPPPTPLTAEAYAAHGLPWFDYYSEAPAIDGGGNLGQALKSIGEMNGSVENPGLTKDEQVVPTKVVPLGPARREQHRVREW